LQFAFFLQSFLDYSDPLDEFCSKLEEDFVVITFLTLREAQTIEGINIGGNKEVKATDQLLFVNFL